MRRFERREVLMPGSSSLADTCVVCGRQPPRFIFFALSGSLCNIAQLALDRALTLVLPPDVWWTPTASWTLSYTFTVPLRHLSHAYCVFGQHADPFWLAMSKTFMTYVSTIVASTAVNMLLVWGDVCKPDIALIITACFSVVWSYVARPRLNVALEARGVPSGEIGRVVEQRNAARGEVSRELRVHCEDNDVRVAQFVRVHYLQISARNTEYVQEECREIRKPVHHACSGESMETGQGG